MGFYESSFPTQQSKNAMDILATYGIYLKEPLSTLSSLLAALLLFIAMIVVRPFIDTSKINDFSLFVLLFTHLSNHVGSAAMHATFDRCMCASDSHTMHIGLIVRLFALLVENNYPTYTYLLCGLMANFIFTGQNNGLVCIVSAVLYVQVMANYEKHIWLRWIVLAAVVSLGFQVLSRLPDLPDECIVTRGERVDERSATGGERVEQCVYEGAIRCCVRKINETIDTHSIWHIGITVTILSYAMVFFGTVPNKNWEHHTHTLSDHFFYLVILVISFGISLDTYLGILLPLITLGPTSSENAATRLCRFLAEMGFLC